MKAGIIPQHISRQFDNELEDVRGKVMAMGGLVEQQLGSAVQALTENDQASAGMVIDREVEVNSFEVTIDQECTRILARRQPTAGDLRLVMAITKTITDLERIGDETKRVAKMAIELAEKQAPKAYYMGINTMGGLVMDMLHDALDAFTRMDPRAALEVVARDRECDEQYVVILRNLMTYMIEDPRNITATLDAVWSARALERIGDHAKNICEYVIYFVEGVDVRHTSLAQIEREISAE